MRTTTRPKATKRPSDRGRVGPLVVELAHGAATDRGNVTRDRMDGRTYSSGPEVRRCTRIAHRRAGRRQSRPAVARLCGPGAEGEIRTHMGSRPAEFKSAASAGSATSAPHESSRGPRERHGTTVRRGRGRRTGLSGALQVRPRPSRRRHATERRAAPRRHCAARRGHCSGGTRRRLPARTHRAATHEWGRRAWRPTCRRARGRGAASSGRSGSSQSAAFRRARWPTDLPAARAAGPDHRRVPARCWRRSPARHRRGAPMSTVRALLPAGTASARAPTWRHRSSRSEPRRAASRPATSSSHRTTARAPTVRPSSTTPAS